MKNKLFTNLSVCIFEFITLGIGISGNVLGMNTNFTPQSQLRIVNLLNNPCSVSTTSDSTRTVDRIIRTHQQVNDERLNKKKQMLEKRKMRKYGFFSASQSETPDQKKVRERYEANKYQNFKKRVSKKKTKEESKQKKQETIERIIQTTKNTLSIPELSEEVKNDITAISKEVSSYERLDRNSKRDINISKYASNFIDTGKYLISSREYSQFVLQNLGPFIFVECLAPSLSCNNLNAFLAALGIELGRSAKRNKFTVEKIISLILPYVVRQDGIPLIESNNTDAES